LTKVLIYVTIKGEVKMEQKLKFKPYFAVKMAPETYAVIEALAHKEGISRIEAARRLVNRTSPINGDGLNEKFDQFRNDFTDMLIAAIKSLGVSQGKLHREMDDTFKEVTKTLRAEAACREEVHRSVVANGTKVKELFIMVRQVRDRNHDEILNAYNQRAELEKMMLKLVAVIETLQAKIEGL